MIWLLLFLVDHKTVANDFKPASQGALRVEHQLTIGDNMEDESTIFGLGIRAAASPEGGDIYVVDPSNFRVVVFNAEGTFLHAFGRKGQGPGELQEPRVLDFDAQGNLVLLDTGSKKMNVYKPDGTFLRDASFNNGIQEIFDLALLDNGNVAFTAVRTDASFQMAFSTNLYDAQLQDLKTLLTIPQPAKDWSQMGDPNFWVTFLKDTFDGYALGYPMATIDGSGHLVVARTNEYRGDIYNAAGELIVQFSKKFKPKPFVDEARLLTYEKIWQGMLVNPFLEPNLTKPVFERALAKTEAPDFLPPMTWVFRLGKGFATLVNWDELKGEGSLEIFDSGGNIIGITSYKGPTEYFYGRGNRLYVTGLDEEDNMVVKVYRVSGL